MAVGPAPSPASRTLPLNLRSDQNDLASQRGERECRASAGTVPWRLRRRRAKKRAAGPGAFTPRTRSARFSGQSAATFGDPRARHAAGAAVADRLERGCSTWPASGGTSNKAARSPRRWPRFGASRRDCLRARSSTSGYSGFLLERSSTNR
jgi:hypothetical protein